MLQGRVHFCTNQCLHKLLWNFVRESRVIWRYHSSQKLAEIPDGALTKNVIHKSVMFDMWDSFNRGPSNCRFCFIALIQKCSLLNTFVNAISSQRCWQLSSFLNIYFKNIKMQRENLRKNFKSKDKVGPQLKKISVFDKKKKSNSLKIRYFLKPVTT